MAKSAKETKVTKKPDENEASSKPVKSSAKSKKKEDDDDYETNGNFPYPYRNALSLGVDIETGGHVFQFHLTNARGMVEKQFIGQNVGSWGKGDIFYGFNIARTFSLDKAARNTHK